MLETSYKFSSEVCMRSPQRSRNYAQCSLRQKGLDNMAQGLRSVEKPAKKFFPLLWSLFHANKSCAVSPNILF